MLTNEPTMPNHDDAPLSHSAMPITFTCDGFVTHDRFYFSSMVSSLEQTFDGLGYDPDDLTASTDVCDQLHEVMTKVTLKCFLTKESFDLWPLINTSFFLF